MMFSVSCFKLEKSKKVEKKKKPRVKEVTKGSGFIPSSNKFKTVENVSPQEINKPSKKPTPTEHKNLLFKENIFSKVEKTTSEPTTKVKIIKEKNIQPKSYLTEKEKEGLYSLIGLVNEEVKKYRDCSILSIEYLYETKQKQQSQANIEDEFFNAEFLKETHIVTSTQGLQSLLTKYNESIIRRIIITKECLKAIIRTCLK